MICYVFKTDLRLEVTGIGDLIIGDFKFGFEGQPGNLGRQVWPCAYVSWKLKEAHNIGAGGI
jgi:hypothetical protein